MLAIFQPHITKKLFKAKLVSFPGIEVIHIFADKLLNPDFPSLLTGFKI